MRKLIGMDHAPDDPGHRLSCLTAIGEAIDGVEPAAIHFGSINGERATARRVMMLARQLLHHVDADEPVRFLIAETEAPFTLPAALYHARLFDTHGESIGRGAHPDSFMDRLIRRIGGGLVHHVGAFG